MQHNRWNIMRISHFHYCAVLHWLDRPTDVSVSYFHMSLGEKHFCKEVQGKRRPQEHNTLWLREEERKKWKRDEAIPLQLSHIWRWSKLFLNQLVSMAMWITRTANRLKLQEGGLRLDVKNKKNNWWATSYRSYVRQSLEVSKNRFG